MKELPRLVMEAAAFWKHRFEWEGDCEEAGNVSDFSVLDQVPTTSPAEAYAFFSAWIQGALNETTSVPDNLVMTELFPAPGVQMYGAQSYRK